MTSKEVAERIMDEFTDGNYHDCAAAIERLQEIFSKTLSEEKALEIMLAIEKDDWMSKVF